MRFEWKRKRNNRDDRYGQNGCNRRNYCNGRYRRKNWRRQSAPYAHFELGKGNGSDRAKTRNRLGKVGPVPPPRAYGAFHAPRPEVADSGVADSDVADSDVADPDVADPDVADSDPARA